MTVKLDKRVLEQLMKENPAKVAAAVADTARAVEAQAKMAAPVDTGFLRNTISAEQQDQFTWIVQDGTEYGIFQELGTSKMAAHPFLTPAIEAQRAPFVQRITRAMEP